MLSAIAAHPFVVVPAEGLAGLASEVVGGINVMEPVVRAIPGSSHSGGYWSRVCLPPSSQRKTCARRCRIPSREIHGP